MTGHPIQTMILQQTFVRDLSCRTGDANNTALHVSEMELLTEDFPCTAGYLDCFSMSLPRASATVAKPYLDLVMRQSGEGQTDDG